jgi:hypothetical protein
MPTSRIRTLALAFTASMTACAHDAPTGSHVSTNDLDATWSTIATILCRLIRFTLTVSDTTITGTRVLRRCRPWRSTHRDRRTLRYGRSRTIAVSPTSPLPPHTRFHELAYVLLGHTTEGEQNDGALTPRNLRECEAEVVAMRCCAALGLPGVEFSGTYRTLVGAGKIPRIGRFGISDQ